MFVLTHEPPHDPEDAEITFLTSRTRDAVATVRAAAGERNVEIFGATTAQGVLREACSTRSSSTWRRYCSATVRLYGDGMPPVVLERTELVEAGQLTSMRFAVTR